MAADKTCILFDGGKKIKLSTGTTNLANEGIKMTKDGDGNWVININVVISKDEADNMIFNFKELNDRLPQDAKFDDTFPNMPYFSALDANDKPVFVKLAANSELLPAYDKDLGGSLLLKMNIANFGKTQNSKTQNVHV